MMISLVFVIVTAISAIPTDLTLKLYSGCKLSISSKLQNCLCATNKAFDTDNESGKHFKVFRNLQPDMFSHPLDKQITRQLSGIPVIASLVRRSLSTVENSFVINNLETTIRVSSNQMPRLNASLMKACKILNIKTPPELYIKQNPLPNAYTLAIDGRRPFIVIHTGLMDILNAAEVEAVIGHELGHLKCWAQSYIFKLSVIHCSKSLCCLKYIYVPVCMHVCGHKIFITLSFTCAYIHTCVMYVCMYVCIGMH